MKIWSIKTVGLLLAGIIALSFAVVFPRMLAFAVGPGDSWTGSGVSTVEENPDGNIKSDCITQNVILEITQTATACMYEQAGWRYGIATWGVNKSFVVGFGTERQVYRVTNFTTDTPVYVQGSNDLLFTFWNRNYRGPYLQVIKDFPTKLQWHIDPVTFARTYELVPNSIEYLLKDSSGTFGATTGGMNVSENGKWLAVMPIGLGLIRINLTDYTMKRFAAINPPYGQGSDPLAEFAVSDDGQHIITTGVNMPFRAFHVTDACGQNLQLIDDYYWTQDQVAEPCVSKDLRPAFADYRWGTNPTFEDQAQVLSLKVRHFSGPDKWYNVMQPGYVKPQRLDYLALGDSYSSGEGDFEKKPDGTSYYTPVSDYEDGCHVGERSYPFKLQQSFDIISAKMKSIACSGAETKDIKFSDREYIGQGDRLKDYSATDRALMQDRALEVFNPGYIEQVKFVKQYKPSSVTLTIGGNDVGFANIIRECAYSFFTCSHANESELRGQAGHAIKKSFKDIKDKVEAIKAASSETKIFLLGYPQFIYDGVAVCGANVGIIDSDERSMMTEGVKYMNKVIEAVTRATGVVYVDIENSLAGGRMCELGGYVTGIQDLRFDDDLYPSAFHPNASGHSKITNAIVQGFAGYNLTTYPYAQSEDDFVSAPEPTPYFINAMASYSKTPQHKIMLNKPVTKNEPISLSGERYSFKPNSTVNKIARSNPVDLGTFTANEDGSFDTTIVIPNSVSAGFHTLILSGESYSGEPIDIYQVIKVQGTNPNDRDEDGIPDASDPCMYLPGANMDMDVDGIDDACDPEISVPKEAYRIRTGATANGELANDLYIERNVNATSLTGITGDYDPDHNGWAIIGSSQSQSQSGPYANFWVSGNNGSKVPHVSLRTAENGCVQYKPTNLARVVDNSPRTFTQEAVDTNTCRSQPASADLDNDGQSDNSQPLYRARSGDPAKGENSARLYLERSTRAAEAQLGKSDYAAKTNSTPISPTDTSDYRKQWSLLASSQAGFVTDTYKKITFVNNYPYVLTSGFFNQCSAYKPQSLATIKQSTQTISILQLDLMQTITLQLKGGCN